MSRVVAVGALFVVLVAISASTSGQAKEPQPAAAANQEKSFRITFASNREGRFQLFSINNQGEDARLLVPDAKGAMEPSWNADGSSVAFVSFRLDREQVFAFDRATASIVNITQSSNHERLPVWSADGKKLAFISNRTGNSEIFVTDEIKTQNLTNHPGYDGDPAWSPDGKQIAFATRRDGAAFELFVMNADGSEQRPLCGEQFGGWMFPDWSPDGKQIVVGRLMGGKNIQLQLLDIASGKLSTITDGEGVNSYARWSPDGRYIAYAHLTILPGGYRPGTDRDQLKEAGGDLMILDVSTGKHRKIISGELPTWGPRPSWEPIP